MSLLVTVVFRSRVTPAVASKVRQLRERLSASGILTLVRFLSGMGPDVLLQVTQLGETATAERTGERLDAEVDARVLRQVGGTGEALVTRDAFVGLENRTVRLLGVNLKT